MRSDCTPLPVCLRARAQSRRDSRRRRRGQHRSPYRFAFRRGDPIAQPDDSPHCSCFELLTYLCMKSCSFLVYFKAPSRTATCCQPFLPLVRSRRLLRCISHTSPSRSPPFRLPSGLRASLIRKKSERNWTGMAREETVLLTTPARNPSTRPLLQQLLAPAALPFPSSSARASWPTRPVASSVACCVLSKGAALVAVSDSSCPCCWNLP